MKRSNQNDNQTNKIQLTHDQLENFQNDIEYLWSSSSSIPIYSQPPTPLFFYKEHVVSNRPCIIQNAILKNTHTMDSVGNKQQNHDEEKQHKQETPLILTLDDIIHLLENSNGGEDDDGDNVLKCTVDVTPDGYGDCVRTCYDTFTNTKKLMFVKPQEYEMTLHQFRYHLRKSAEMLSSSSSFRNTNQHSSHGNIKTEYSNNTYNCYDKNSTNEEISSVNECSKNSSNDTFDKSIFYYSRQNDCLRNEFKPLFDKEIFPQTFPFVNLAFSSTTPNNDYDQHTIAQPEAINIWIGNEYATSSIHKDHYENLFYVLSGEKIFTLCPPGNTMFLQEQEYDSGTFHYHQCGSTLNDDEHKIKSEKLPHDEGLKSNTPSLGSWIVHHDVDLSDNDEDRTKLSKVRWIEADIEKLIQPTPIPMQESYIRKFPLLQYVKPIRIHVKAGEMLYLPSLWYHQVTQSCETVGINYWYDMKFDSPLWVYFNLLSHMKVQHGSTVVDNVDSDEKK